ncbi:MAG: ABC transporter ATP-binding protein/permease [Planctomycetota bacterium]|nr:ABC transporter ATP-binding protein/permease [Planctomycetota bacterium]
MEEVDAAGTQAGRMLAMVLPPYLADMLDSTGVAGEIRFSQKSDLTQTGSFADYYLVVKGDHLLALTREGVVFSLPLSDLGEVRIVELLGGALLVASRRTGGEIRLVKYSKTMIPEFGVYCRVLNDLREGRVPRLPESDGRVVCPRCGNPLPERGANCPACINFFSVFRRLLGLLGGYRQRLLVLVAATFLGVAAQIGPPYLTKEITDEVILAGDIQRLPWLIGAMAICAFLYFIARYVQSYLSSWLSARLISDLRTRLHAHLQRLNLGYFSRREAGELVSRVMHDTQELQHFLIDGLPYLFVNLIAFFAIAGVLLVLDWRLAVVVFLPVPVLILGVRWIWSGLHGLFMKEGNRWATLHNVLGESMRGLRAVKAAAQEDERSHNFGSLNQSIFGIVVRIDRAYAAFSEGTYLVMSLAVTLVWFLAASRITGLADREGLSLGDLTAYVGYMWMFYGPLQWFTVIANWMNYAFAAAERIFAVLDAEAEVYDPPSPLRVSRFRGRVEFRDVRFSYERGKEIIRGIKLDLSPGDMVGLVGRSGAGKSTIINLLCRFFDVDSGEIRIDDMPIRQMRLVDLRRQIGMVMQEPFLFRASILENISYGFPDTPFEQVVRAAKAAHAHDFIIDKEFAYDTLVGEGGVTLSGGERQRLAIARAILHDPPILILDEATSSVDSETEKAIQDAIAELIQNRTVIAIAHRLATLRNANRLVVVEDGRIVESGTHADLVAGGGIYANLVKTQIELSRLRGTINPGVEEE